MVVESIAMSKVKKGEYAEYAMQERNDMKCASLCCVTLQAKKSKWHSRSLTLKLTYLQTDSVRSVY